MNHLEYLIQLLLFLLDEPAAKLVLAAVLCVLLLPWAYFKRRTKALVRELNCGDTYWKLKREFDSRKLFRFFSGSVWMFGGLLVIAVPVLLVLLAVFLLMSFVTLFGIMYVDTGADSSVYFGLADFVQIMFVVLAAAACGLYISLCVNLIRSAWVERAIYNTLQENPNDSHFGGSEE